MKKLKVTWQDGLWDRPEQTTAEAEVSANATVKVIGDTLVFLEPGGRTVLVVPEARLISAVEVEVPE